MPEVRVGFGAEVKRHRKRAKLSQEQLAEKLGLTREAISQIERGKTRRPSEETLLGLEATIGLTRDLAYRLIAALPDPNHEDTAVLLHRIAAIQDDDERWEAWNALPERLRFSLFRFAGDLLRNADQLARAASEQSAVPG